MPSTKNETIRTDKHPRKELYEIIQPEFRKIVARLIDLTQSKDDAVALDACKVLISYNVNQPQR